MTLGRPSLIPESHVRVGRPSNIRPPPVTSPDGPMNPSVAEASLDFYNITMCVSEPPHEKNAGEANNVDHYT